MCGRFTSLFSPEVLENTFGVQAPPDISPRYNIAPTQQVWIIRGSATGGRHLSSARWGLVPHWAKDLSIGNRMINARCETVHEKPAFRQSIQTRRCIVPASGFFEWTTTPTGKTPHYVTMRDGSPLAFAGIWESWKTSEGEDIETFAILTTTANCLMAPIHDRMPVILHQTELELWLERSVNNPLKLQRLYQPYPAELLQEWAVSTAVNNPAHEKPETITPVEPQP
ncbi:MAG: SOS response-associated peptidase [Deltaproteobacteria bacterium]|nr:SOS response-associated peptidase [Deltaproteobacteria bacterium]